jgi:hypothetical protein
MAFRFYRRIRLIPGLRVNFSRSGQSLSVGHRGAWLTFGPRGRRATVGLPGTGLFWTEHAPPTPLRHVGRGWALAAVVVVIAIAALVMFSHFGGR